MPSRIMIFLFIVSLLMNPLAYAQQKTDEPPDEKPGVQHPVVPMDNLSAPPLTNEPAPKEEATAPAKPPSPEQLKYIVKKKVDEIQKLIETEKPEEAMEMVDKLIKDHPQVHTGYQLRGDILLKIEEYELALKSYERVIKHFKSDIQFYKNMTRCLVKLERYDEALTQLMYMKRFDEIAVWAHIELGKLCLDLERPLDAASHLKIAANNFTDMTAEEEFSVFSLLALAYVQAGKISDTKTILGNISEENLTSPIIKRVQALLAILEERSDEAYQLLTGVISEFPQDLYLHITLANLCLDRKQPQEALKYLDQTTNEKKIEREDFLQVYAKTAVAARDKQKAIWAYSILYKANPKNIEIRDQLINGYETAGQLSEAEIIYRKAIALDPDDETLKMKLVANLRLQGKAEEGLSLVEIMLLNQPQDQTLRTEQALLLFTTGKLREAISILKNILEIEKFEPAAKALSLIYTTRGLVFYYWDLNHKTLEQLRLSLEYNPDRPVLKKFIEELNTLRFAHPKAIKLVVDSLEKKEENTLKPVDKARLATFYSRLDQNEKAIDILTETVSSSPKLVPAVLNLASVLKKTGNDEKAETLLRKLEENNPMYLPIHYHLADIYFNRLNFDKATEEHAICFAPITDFGKLAEDMGIIIADGTYDLSPDLYNVILLTTGHGKVRSNLGDLYQEQSKYDEAIIQYRFAVTVNEQDVDTWYQLGNAYFKKDDLTKAEETFNQVLVLQPENVFAVTNLGLINQRNGNSFKAIEYFETAAGLKNNQPSIYNNLGSAYLSNGQTDKAIQVLEQAISINPNYSGALTNLGNSYLAKGDKKRAAEYYKQAIKQGKKTPEAHFNLGSLLLDEKSQEEALRQFEAAIEIKKDYSLAYINRGIILNQSGKKEEALESFKKGTELAPSNFKGFFNLGNVLSDLDRHDEAVEALAKAAELAPQEVDAHLNLGVQLVQVKRLKEAVEHLLKVTELDPDNAEAYYNLSIIYQDVKWIPRAIETMEKAISLDTHFETAETLKNLGIMYLMQNDLEHGKKTLQQSLSKDASQTDITDILKDL